MIVYDFEVFRYDFMICWLDLKTRKFHHIVNDKEAVKKMYQYYKNDVWIGYNSRNYDQWILKAILCDFEPWEMNDWLINKERKGFEFSRLLSNFPLINYDCSVGFRSLKELEAFMGHDIRETSVPFDINRPLTDLEIKETLKYCKHDVWEAFEVFVQTQEEWESHVGLVEEFKLPLTYLSKTKAQLSAIILGAERPSIEWKDEFDIRFPDTINLGRYEWVKDYYTDWANNAKNSDDPYKNLTIDTTIGGIPTTYGAGGLHGAKKNYIGTGFFLMADVGSFYPAEMIEYDFLSRNVKNKAKFKIMRDERIVMKTNKDPRQKPRKIVLNSTFGASKDKYNALYDPLMANNVCIGGQLLLTDLIDKLEGKCEMIQYNTDGILVRLFNEADKKSIINICNEWSKRTRMELEFDDYVKVFQKDVNNYILVDKNGKLKCKGAYVKKLSSLDNDLPIVNKAIVDYFVNSIPVEKTIHECDKLIEFQKVTKISKKYDYAYHNGKILHEKVHRCFASLDQNDTALMKKHKSKDTLDKTASTPNHCFIINENILEMPIPSKLDKLWYIELAKNRINDFLGIKC